MVSVRRQWAVPTTPRFVRQYRPRSRGLKRQYYSQPGVVDRYDAWRFGSEGGRYVGQREIDSVLDLMREVRRDARILDMPVGTGRLSRALIDAGYSNVEGADYSLAMLEKARERCGAEFITSRQDAFATYYADQSFDAVVCVRFVFHHAETQRLLREICRLLRPGGLLVADTLRWSPRSVLPALQRSLGGVVYTHRDDAMKCMLADAGFELLAHRRILLVPSLVYRFVPAFLVEPLDRAERRLPSALCSKSFWSARRLVPSPVDGSCQSP